MRVAMVYCGGSVAVMVMIVRMAVRVAVVVCVGHGVVLDLRPGSGVFDFSDAVWIRGNCSW